jgi:DtxR family Mn-dependent transcriptional regulator
MSDLSIKYSQTIEDYLSLIYVIERDGEPVIGARLAEILKVSAPTVTNTLKRMVRDGLITMQDNGTHLTEAGWESARIVVRKHMLMEWMVLKMLPWSRLHTEAHNLEHAISEEAENALFEELSRPATCPHGNPLPGYEDTVANWVPLTQLKLDQFGIVKRIHELAEENTELMEYLEAKEVTIGKRVQVSEILPFNHTLTILANGHPVTLGFTVARYIFVDLEA